MARKKGEAKSKSEKVRKVEENQENCAILRCEERDFNCELIPPFLKNTIELHN